MRQKIVPASEHTRALAGRFITGALRAKEICLPVGVATTVLLLLGVILSTVPVASSPDETAETPNNAASTHNPEQVVFHDDTLTAGITFSHLQGDERLTGIDETLGGGACAFDYDNDGWVDLFLVNGTGQTRYYGVQHWWHAAQGHALYRNLGAGRFEQRTGAAGLSSQSWGMGCAAADFDNDGDADLLVTNRGANRLYRNDGDGSFTDITENSGIAGNSWSTSAVVADFDDDGLLDVYVANYVELEKGAATYEGASQFLTTVPRSFSPDLYVAQANRLYRNLGGLAFKDVTTRAGVADASGRGLSAAWLDVNRDRRPDILVTNGAGTTNVTYINQGDGRFEEAGERYRLNDARGSYGIGVGDIDADGFFDVAVSTGIGQPPLLLINEMKADGSGRVFRNRTRNLGVGGDASAVFAGWGIALRDFNNNGRLDLFQANGLTTPDPDSPKLPQGQPKRLWLQAPSGRFSDTSEDSGVALSDTQSARGVATADFDNDGDVDVYVAHNNGLGQLLTNQGSHGHWLGVELEGRSTNRDGVGAVVRLRTASGGEQYRRVSRGGFLAGGERRLHFGLGDQTRVAELAVTWPDGATDVLTDLHANRYVRIVEGDSTAREPVFETPVGAGEPELGLRVAARRPAHRIQFLQWVVASQGLTGARAELKAAVNDTAPAVRIAALELVSQHRESVGLALLVEALEDPNVKVRLAALDAARQYESEASIRWLLRTFRDPEPAVRTRVADVFRFFFKEEEALVHGKFLALPYLIRLLDDSDADVRAAAARALGAAERYRAIEPLLARLDDPAPRVRAAAAASLGMIRDRKAAAALRAAMADTSQPPLVRARSIIALKRLGALPAGAVESAFGDAIEQRGAAGVRAFLRTLKAVFTDAENSVVLDREALLRTMDRIVNVVDLSAPGVKRLAIDVLEAAAAPRGVQRLAAFTQDPDPGIRRRAYDALVTVDRVGRAAHYRRALSDPSIVVRTAAFRRIAMDRVAVPMDLLLDGLGHPATKELAVRAIGRAADPKELARLRRITMKESETPAVRVAAVESMIPSAAAAPALPDTIHASDHPALRAAALRLWAARRPARVPARSVPAVLSRALRDAAPSVRRTAVDVLLARRESWATRYLVDSVSDSSADAAMRRRIVAGLRKEMVQEAQQPLLAIARKRHGPLRVSAIDALLRGGDDAVVRRLMWGILNDPDENERLRFTAAQALQARDEEGVLETLRTG